MRRIALLFSVLCLLLAGCGRTTGQIPSDPPQGSSAADQAPQETVSSTEQPEIFPDDEIPDSSKPSGGSLPAASAGQWEPRGRSRERTPAEPQAEQALPSRRAGPPPLPGRAFFEAERAQT